MEASGSLDIQDTYISKTNETSETTLLDNLDVNFKGYGSVLLSKSVISLELNASIYFHVAEVLGLKNITFNLTGVASAKISFDESGKIILGQNTDQILLDIKDVIIEAEDIISAGANRIFFKGIGEISITGKKITLSSSSIESEIDNLFINTDLGQIYLNGEIYFDKTGTLSLEFEKLLCFNLSYTGTSSLLITNVDVKIYSNIGNVSASVDSITIDTAGYVDISYYKQKADAACNVTFSNICISRGLTLTFDDRSLSVPFDICGSGRFNFYLTADILIEYAPDLSWIKITIGGNGNSHVDAYAMLYTEEKSGFVDVDVELETGDKPLVIYLYNLKSNNKGFEINGSASANLIKLRFILRNETACEEIINISLENFKVNFDLIASGGSGSILFNVNEGGLALR